MISKLLVKLKKRSSRSICFVFYFDLDNKELNKICISTDLSKLNHFNAFFIVFFHSLSDLYRNVFDAYYNINILIFLNHIINNDNWKLRTKEQKKIFSPII